MPISQQPVARRVAVVKSPTSPPLRKASILCAIRACHSGPTPLQCHQDGGRRGRAAAPDTSPRRSPDLFPSEVPKRCRLMSTLPICRGKKVLTRFYRADPPAADGKTTLLVPTHGMHLFHEHSKPVAVLRRAGLPEHRWKNWQAKYGASIPWLFGWLYHDPLPADVRMYFRAWSKRRSTVPTAPSRLMRRCTPSGSSLVSRRFVPLCWKRAKRPMASSSPTGSEPRTSQCRRSSCSDSSATRGWNVGCCVARITCPRPGVHAGADETVPSGVGLRRALRTGRRRRSGLFTLVSGESHPRRVAMD